MRIAVAGATGSLGRAVARALKARGHAVHALGRDAGRLAAVGAESFSALDLGDSAAIAQALAGCDGVFSCLGAPAQAILSGWSKYSRVDTPINVRLADAAVAAGVRRFTYVSVLRAKEHPELDYMRAHEAVVEHLAKIGLDWRVVRPTGFFSAFSTFVAMAKKGPVPCIGDGKARSNPIHDLDLAEACADAIEGGPQERDVGGPEVLTRQEVLELACRAVGKPVRIRHVAPGLARFGAVMMRPFHPRLSALTSFIVTAMTEEFVAPAYGSRRLEDYFRTLSASSGSRDAHALAP